MSRITFFDCESKGMFYLKTAGVCFGVSKSWSIVQGAKKTVIETFSVNFSRISLINISKIVSILSYYLLGFVNVKITLVDLDQWLLERISQYAKFGVVRLVTREDKSIKLQLRSNMINEQEHLLSFISLSKGAVQFLWVWADRSILK